MYALATMILAMVAPAASFKANSKAGQKLLQNARKLNDERDVTWMPNYSIRFDKCHSLVQVAGGEEGGNDENDSLLYTQHLVEFSICPSQSCVDNSNKCNGGGRYIANTLEFTQMYLAYKEEELERVCESIADNCYNDDENYCYQKEGMYECIENDDNNQEEDIERYLECELVENDDNNNGNNYNYNDGVSLMK